MEDATGRLEQRRGEIEGRLFDIGTPKSNTTGAREQPALWLERAIIEQTLAQLAATDALRRDTEAREAARQSQDDAAYWWRAFNTSLAIGNGTGFAVVSASVLQSSHLNQSLVFAWEFAIYFGFGVLCAGALPFVLWAQRRYPKISGVARMVSNLVTVFSAGFFALGIGFAIHRIDAAQRAVTPLAEAERKVEGAELAKRWLAAGLKGLPPLPH